MINEQGMKSFDWKSPLFILLITLLIHLPPAISLPLLDRDEPRFAQATATMVEKGEWIVPYFNGVPRFDKPILSYWLMALGEFICGKQEVAFRLHSILFLALTGWLIFVWLDGEWGKRKGAWVGVLGWIFTFQNLIHGHLALADMPMVFSVAWILFLWRSEGSGMRNEDESAEIDWWKAALWAIPLTLGFLCKGPIAWGVPLLALLLNRYGFKRASLNFPMRTMGIAFLLATVGVAMWGGPALLLSRGDFWRVGIHYHVVERGLGTFNHRSYLPFYYLLSIWLSLFPFSGYLVSIVKKAFGERTEENCFLLGWFFSSILIFSFYSTQLPHYILPSLPAFFILFGRWIDSRNEGDLIWTRGLKIQGALALLIAAFLGYLAWRTGGVDDIKKIQPLFITLAVVVVSGGIGIGRLLKFDQLRVLAKFGILMAMIYGGSLFILGMNLRENHPTIALARFLGHDRRIERGHANGFQEPSLNYYLGGVWSFGEESSSDAQCIVRQVSEERIFPLLLKTRMEKRSGDSSEKNNSSFYDVEGFNPARFSWVKLKIDIEP